MRALWTTREPWLLPERRYRRNRKSPLHAKGASVRPQGWGVSQSCPSLAARCREVQAWRARRRGPSSTHQLGALVRAVAREGVGRLLRGDGHHGRVHQAQLHDPRVIAPQLGRVVQADARGVPPAWGKEGQRRGSPLWPTCRPPLRLLTCQAPAVPSPEVVPTPHLPPAASAPTPVYARHLHHLTRGTVTQPRGLGGRSPALALPGRGQPRPWVLWGGAPGWFQWGGEGAGRGPNPRDAR